MNKNKKNKKRMSKKAKIKLIFVILMLILVAFIIGYFVVGGKNSDDKAKTKVVDEIKKFNYTVSDSDSKLFKEKFKELKKVLSEKEVDNKKYATLVSELFVIDFYTLDNKLTKNDVGGVQFVYTKHQADFIDKARDGMYKQVKNNLDNDRKQSLPEVDTIEVVSTEEVVPSAIFESEDFKNVTDAEAYEIKLKWTYKNDDKFQKEATVVVVKDSDKLSVAKLSDGE